ncbi:uncharacterized protein LOC125854676 [Solanum stenotomum]|uniref:uncharacterized protein LOC125854676 n=1 Tax=Solanum stenotomum TaxID=172797 RepID=UPI0020D1D7A7|nr:uncharacterized protein LOC125854676 [Solanum stenotomum]
MKSKIRVLFESFISCGKPSKGNDKDQEPVPLDESTIDEQGQRQELEQEHQDKPKDYAQRQGLLVKDEQKNAQLGQMVENAKVEQVERVFVMESRVKITTYRNIGTTSQQAKRSRQRPPPGFKTGSRDLM